MAAAEPTLADMEAALADIDVAPPLPRLPRECFLDGERYRDAASNGVRLRAAAAMDSAVVGDVERGAVLVVTRLLELESGAVRAEAEAADGRRGWASLKLL